LTSKYIELATHSPFKCIAFKNAILFCKEM
jgi:hypothetical protein